MTNSEDLYNWPEPAVFSWLENYLTDRTQCVFTDGVKSGSGHHKQNPDN